MAERKPLSKRTRFEVFKRDSFCCVYCNRTPPAVTLEVDHIIPVSKKGTNVIDNLVTACFDCNSGKSNIDLTTRPKKLQVDPLLMKERQEQYREYQKWVIKIETLIQSDIQKVEDALKMTYPNASFSEAFKNTSIKNFISKLGVQDVVYAIHKACDKNLWHLTDTFKYFCGICWSKIKAKYPDPIQKKEVDNG